MSVVILINYCSFYVISNTKTNDIIYIFMLYSVIIIICLSLYVNRLLWFNMLYGIYKYRNRTQDPSLYNLQSL